MPSFRRHVFSTLILAGILLGIGIGNFFEWDLVWPIILIVLEFSVLLGGVLRRR